MSPPLRVAIACHGIWPLSSGGMERHTFNLARSLEQEGISVEVLAPSPAAQTFFPFPVHFLDWPKTPHWLWSHWNYSRNVAAWLALHKPDIAFGQGFGLWAYPSSKSAPTVFHPHGLEMYGSHLSSVETLKVLPFRSVVRRLARKSDRVVSLGPPLTKILTHCVGVPGEKIVEIPNAVDLAQFAPTNRPRTPHSLLFVGRLAFNKGLDLLIAAMKKTKHLDYRITMAGGGPIEKDVLHYAKQDARLHFVGEVNDDELKTLYASHESLIFTSRFEGMPTVILEAMASGMAVIATRIGAVESVVTPASAILTAPDGASIAEAIERFIQLTEKEKHAMGLAGLERARTHFSWSVVVKQFIQLFEEMRHADSRRRRS